MLFGLFSSKPISSQVTVTNINRIASIVSTRSPGFVDEFLKVFPNEKSVINDLDAISLWSFIDSLNKSKQQAIDTIAAAIKIFLNNFYLNYLHERKLEYTHRELVTFSIAGNRNLFIIYQMISLKAQEIKHKERVDFYNFKKELMRAKSFEAGEEDKVVGQPAEITPSTLLTALPGIRSVNKNKVKSFESRPQIQLDDGEQSNSSNEYRAG